MLQVRVRLPRFVASLPLLRNSDRTTIASRFPNLYAPILAFQKHPTILAYGGGGVHSPRSARRRRRPWPGPRAAWSTSWPRCYARHLPGRGRGVSGAMGLWEPPNDSPTPQTQKGFRIPTLPSQVCSGVGFEGGVRTSLPPREGIGPHRLPPPPSGGSRTRGGARDRSRLSSTRWLRWTPTTTSVRRRTEPIAPQKIRLDEFGFLLLK